MAYRTRAAIVGAALIVSSAFFAGASAQAATVTGTVVTADGKPISGATVTMQEYDGTRMISVPAVTTDAAGNFSLTASDDVIPTSMRTRYGVFLFAHAPGYGFDSLGFKPGTPIRITLSPEKVLRGMVADGMGKPVAGVPISLGSIRTGTDGGGYLQPIDSFKDRFTAKTNAMGQWELRGISEKVVSCEIFFDDPRFVHLIATIKTGAEPARNVIPARPGGTISGRITDAAGKPVADVVVTAGRSDRQTEVGIHEPGSSARTDATGAFRVGQLGTGTFAVTVDAKKQDLVVAATAGIAVVAGKTTPVEKPIVLTPGALIAGSVIAKGSGKPVSAVSIYANDWSNATQTAADGTYRIRVIPGENVINIGSKNEGFAYFNPSKAVTAKEGETNTLPPFELPPAVNVTLRIVGEDNKPMAGLPVRVFHPGWRDGRNENDSPKTDAEGLWNSENDPGADLTPDVKDPWEVRVASGWEVVSPTVLKLDAAMPILVTVRKVNPSLRPRGRVVTPEGKPVAEADISVNSWLKDTNGNQSDYKSDHVSTDQNGQFVLAMLRPKSTVTLSLYKQEHRYRPSDPVVIAEGGKQPDFGDLVLTPLSGVLSGTVIGANGKPIPGAWVWSPDGDMRSHARTDAKGAFTIEYLPSSGDVSLSLARGTATATFSVASRKNSRLNLAASAPPVSVAAQTARNRARANAIIATMATEAEVGQALRDNGQKGRDTLADTVAAVDIDTALKIGTDKTGKVTEAVLSGILDEALPSQPERARELFVANVKTWSSPWRTLWRSSDMAEAFATKDPAFAAQCYALARKQLTSGIPEGWVYENMLVAKLAYRLNTPDVAEWEARAIELVTKSEGNDANKGIASVARQLAEGDGTRAAKLLSRLPKEQHGEVARSILDWMTSADSGNQTLAAKRLLDNWIADGTVKPGGDHWNQGGFDDILIRIAKKLAPTDPDAAYAAAKLCPENSRWEALLFAASGQKDATTRLKRYRDALTGAGGPGGLAVRYPLCLLLARRTGDTAFATEIHNALVKSVANDPEAFDGNATRTSLRMALAAGQTAPDMCRFYIEAAMAQTRQYNPDGDNAFWMLRDSLRAMAMIAPDRALEIAGSIRDVKNQNEAKREIVRVLLTPRDKWYALIESE
ncbi:MAG: carboxypeptidase regulatory-like domain-containing protein [Fibrella sp.]|nr:carboxypeptidase regulatory-like domain-containing protein [Armatimonadota bacterium]